MKNKSLQEVLTELGYGYLYRPLPEIKHPTFCMFCNDADLDDLALHYGCKVCGNGGYFDMTDKEFMERATKILHNMALERKRPWWRRVFHRWYISDEPLRHDAARLLRDAQKDPAYPINHNYLGYAREN